MYTTPIRCRSTGASISTNTRPVLSCSNSTGLCINDSPRQLKTPKRASSVSTGSRPAALGVTPARASGRALTSSGATPTAPRKGGNISTGLPSGGGSRPSGSPKRVKKSGTAGVSVARVFDSVPQRGFFAPCKCAATVVAFSEAKCTSHTPPIAATFPPVLVPATTVAPGGTVIGAGAPGSSLPVLSPVLFAEGVDGVSTSSTSPRQTTIWPFSHFLCATPLPQEEEEGEEEEGREARQLPRDVNNHQSANLAEGGALHRPPSPLAVPPPLYSLEESMNSLMLSAATGGPTVMVPRSNSAALTTGKKKKKSGMKVSQLDEGSSCRTGSSVPGHARRKTALSSAAAAAKALSNCRGKTYIQDQENKYADFAQCTASGLHTSLWTSCTDGSIELRTLACPSVLLNVIPPYPSAEESVMVTALQQIGQNHVVAGDANGRLRVYHCQTGHLVEVKQAHLKAVTCMTLVLMPTDNNPEDDPNELYYPRASVLLTGSLDGTLAKWDGVTLECLGRLSAGKKGITALAGSLSGCYAFSGCEGGTLRFWNLMENAEIKLSASERIALREFREAGDTCSQSCQSIGFGGHRTAADSVSNTSFQEGVGSGFSSPRLSLSKGDPGNAFHHRLTGAQTPQRQRAGGNQWAPSSAPRLRSGGVSAPQDGTSALKRNRLGSSMMSPGRAPSVASSSNHATPVRAGRKAPLSAPGTPIAPRTPKAGRLQGDKGAPTGFSSVLRSRTGTMPMGASTPNMKKKPSERRISSMECETLLSKLESALQDFQSRIRVTSPGGGSSGYCTDYPPLPSCGNTMKEECSGLNFEFPIQMIHKDQITGLEVIEDRFLISCSRDATANVFTLPSGRHVKTLKTEGRRGPISKVVYDKPTSRLLLFTNDGEVTGFNMRSSRMEVVLKLSTGMTTPFSVYTVLQSRSFYRFVLLSTGKDGDGLTTSMISAIAQIDRNTSGPKKKKKKLSKKKLPGDTATVIKTAVGELSTEEFETMQTFHKLQRTCWQNRRTVEAVRTMGSVEEMEMEDLRKCGVTFQRWYLRRFLSMFFLRWLRWTERRIRITARLGEVQLMEEEVHDALRQRYFSKWRFFQRRQASLFLKDTSAHFSTRIPGEGVVSVGSGHRSWGMLKRQRYEKLASFLSTNVRLFQQRRFFTMWMTFMCERKIFERRQMAYNRLLLSVSGTSHSTAALVLTAVKNKALRSATQERALKLLQDRMQVHTTRMMKRYFRQWCRFRDEAQQHILESGWQPPLLCRPQALLSRYFMKWVGFATHFVREERLERESAMLKQEWLTLQNTIDDRQSIEDLRKEVVAVETDIVRISYEKDAQDAKRHKVEQELSNLRMRDTLRTFLNGFDPMEDSQISAELRDGTPSISAVSTPVKYRSHQRTRSWFKALGGVEDSPELDLYPNVSPAESAVAMTGESGSELRRQLFCVLRGLKGYVLHLGRDYVKVSVAYESTSSLCLTDTNFDTSRRSMSSGSVPYRSSALLPGSRQHGVSKGAAPRASGAGGGYMLEDTGFDTTSFSSISEAFDGITSELVSVLYAAAREAGIDPSVDAQLLGSRFQPSTSAGERGGGTGGDASLLGGNFGGVRGGAGAGAGHMGQSLTTPFSTTPPAEITPRSNFSLSLQEDGGAAPPPIRMQLTPGLVQPRGGAELPGGDAVVSCSPRDSPSSSMLGGSHSVHAASVSAAGGGGSTAIHWLQFVSRRTRQEVMDLVAHLLVLFDSFTIHNENMIMESRATQALPLSSLCNTQSAAQMVRHAPILFELLHPQIWQRQCQLSRYKPTLTAEMEMVVCRNPEQADPLDEDVTARSLLHAPGLPSASVLSRPASAPRVRPSSQIQQTQPSRTSSTPPACQAATPISKAQNSHHSSSKNNAGNQPYRAARGGGGGGGGSGGVLPELPSRPTTLTREMLTSTPVVPMLMEEPSPVRQTGWLTATPRSSGLFSGAQSTTGSLGGYQLPRSSYMSGTDGLRYDEDEEERRSMRSIGSTPRASSLAGLLTSGAKVYQKPFLGFRVQVARDAASNRSAIFIKEVTPTYVSLNGEQVAGPAAVAGLRVGDQFVRFAHYAVTDLAAFNAVVQRHVRAGAELPVVVLRNGETISTSLRVAVRLS